MTLFDNVIVLDKFIPTTKICMECGKTYDMKPSQRTFKCTCGVKEDRDIHAAKNMIVIAKSCFEDGFVPPEQREITLTEFKATVADEILSSKSGQRSEKITPFKV